MREDDRLPDDPRQYLPGHVSQHFGHSILASFLDRSKAEAAAEALSAAGYRGVEVSRINDQPRDRNDLRRSPYPRTLLEEAGVDRITAHYSRSEPPPEGLLGRFAYLLTVPLGAEGAEQAEEIIRRHGGDLDAHAP